MSITLPHPRGSQPTRPRLGGGRCRGHAITKVARLAAQRAAQKVSDSLMRSHAWDAGADMREAAVFLAYRLESAGHDLAVALSLLEQGRYREAHQFLDDVLRTATDDPPPFTNAKRSPLSS